MQRVLYFFLLLANTVSAQVDLNLGLRAYYPFTGNASDVSGNNNQPVFNNAVPTADRFGNANSAYSFNGLDTYIRVPNSSSLNTSNQLSLCAWVNVKGFYYGTCHTNSMIMKGDLDFLTGNYLLRFDETLFDPNGCSTPLTDTIHQNFRGINAPPTPYTPYINKNQWYSVVCTYDGTTTRLYVNCELKYSIASSQTFTNSYDLFFGRMNNATFPYWFKGVLDEIRIYDRALNIDEVKAYGDCAGLPDLTSSQFFTTTQVQAGGSINEVMVIRNVGTGPTSAPFTFNITNYAALTGLTITPIPEATTVTIGFSNYSIARGWTYNAGTFTCSNVIPAGGSSNLGLVVSRGTGGSAGANGTVTQTTTIPPGTGGGETPTNNNSISNFLLKN